MGPMFWRSAIYLNSSSKLNTYQGDDLPQPAGAAIRGLIYSDMCGAGMLISRPGYHTISWPVSPVSPIGRSPISYLDSPQPGSSPGYLDSHLPSLSRPSHRPSGHRTQNDKCSLLTTTWTLNTLRVSVRLFTVTLVTMSELIPAQPTSDTVLIILILIHHITILSFE